MNDRRSWSMQPSDRPIDGRVGSAVVPGGRIASRSGCQKTLGRWIDFRSGFWICPEADRPSIDRCSMARGHAEGRSASAEMSGRAIDRRSGSRADFGTPISARSGFLTVFRTRISARSGLRGASPFFGSVASATGRLGACSVALAHHRRRQAPPTAIRGQAPLVKKTGMLYSSRVPTGCQS